ncbi:MAG: hypothetical protein O7G86_20380 [Gammaproteobacteria bacterium]|nr:hypothetical protein [Gammaproteobacteria bacterium]
MKFDGWTLLGQPTMITAPREIDELLNKTRHDLAVEALEAS